MDNMEFKVLGTLEEGEAVTTIKIDNVVYICKTNVQKHSSFKGVQPDIKMHDNYKKEEKKYNKDRYVLKQDFVEPGDTSLSDVDKQIEFIRGCLPKLQLGVDVNDQDIKG